MNSHSPETTLMMRRVVLTADPGLRQELVVTATTVTLLSNDRLPNCCIAGVVKE